MEEILSLVKSSLSDVPLPISTTHTVPAPNTITFVPPTVLESLEDVELQYPFMAEEIVPDFEAGGFEGDLEMGDEGD